MSSSVVCPDCGGVYHDRDVHETAARHLLATGRIPQQAFRQDRGPLAGVELGGCGRWLIAVAGLSLAVLMYGVYVLAALVAG